MASTSGVRPTAYAIAEPTPIRSVTAAIAATETIADRFRNSPDQAASNPACSARRTMSCVSRTPPASKLMPLVVISTFSRFLQDLAEFARVARVARRVLLGRELVSEREEREEQVAELLALGVGEAGEELVFGFALGLRRVVPAAVCRPV